jgi:hypothetical protein
MNWPAYEFIFSTVDGDNMEFGENPRLEFPECGTSHVMSSWYAEKDDEFGKRLELRFATPDSMDVQIWRGLSEHDQLLVAAVIAYLPTILRETVDESITGKHSREQWVKLADLVKIIFANNFTMGTLAAK